MNTLKLHNALAAVAPIVGVSVGRADDKATWRIDFAADATSGQRDAAQSVLAAFDAAAPDPARWTPLEFLERFTQAERIAIRAAAAGASTEALQLADWLDLLRASTEVVADDPRTVAGMAALVAAGLLSEARRAEILEEGGA